MTVIDLQQRIDELESELREERGIAEVYMAACQRRLLKIRTLRGLLTEARPWFYNDGGVRSVLGARIDVALDIHPSEPPYLRGRLKSPETRS